MTGLIFLLTGRQSFSKLHLFEKKHGLPLADRAACEEAMKTEVAKAENVKRDWYLVDAQDIVLGRLATQIAGVLRGKNKAIFTPSVDTGDFVIVVNAEKIALTGRKLDDKIYYSHTGFPGGLKEITAGKLLEKRPEDIIRKAVKGMLPKNKLARHMLKKLKVYAGASHPHDAQQPKNLAF
jgi:large subunit ribosomal protein L13